KEHIMKITKNRKMVTAAIGAAATAVTAPALLFAGAGTAQALTWVSTNTDALGVTVHVSSFGGPASSGTCNYTAVPANVPPGVLPPLPVYGLPFLLEANGTHDIWFPGIQTGTTWDVTVHCANGVDSPTTHVVY
ncbi:MAG TPA: hypothetical protein VN888_26565, partial [Mycobacterium sp.]|nr:hypothetical protein [Mycobacterium sp.]